MLALPAGSGPPRGEGWWGLRRLRERLGTSRAELKRRVAGSVAWAGLEAAGSAACSVADLIDWASVGREASSQELREKVEDCLAQGRGRAARAEADGHTSAGPSRAASSQRPSHDSSQYPAASSPFAPSAGPSSAPPYLFDWSLPQHCPGLLDEFVVPSYFCADLLQRTPEGSLLRESWPSLFIGPRCSRCAVHVDAYGR